MDAPKQNATKPLRKDPTPAQRAAILLEAGYKCSNPICPHVTLDVHHIVAVAEGGKTVLENLIALCVLCHRRITVKEIPESAARVWKGVLVRLNGAFARETIDLLRFLNHEKASEIRYRGGDLLKFAPLVASGLVSIERESKSPGSYIFAGTAEDAERMAAELEEELEKPELDDTWQVTLSEAGRLLLGSWVAGQDLTNTGLDRMVTLGDPATAIDDEE